MKTIVIYAGGPAESLLSVDSFDLEQTAFIGVDRGALYLLQAGVTPIEAVGDFDSVTEEEYERIAQQATAIYRVQSEKDETDTELALERALSYEPEHIVLTGVTGGRLDHFQSALHLLYRIVSKKLWNGHCHAIRLADPKNEIAILTAGVHRVQRHETLPYISFFAFAEQVEGLTLTGFKYETINETLAFGTTRFTSNEMISDVCTISFRQGICLMVRSSDS